MTLKKQHKTNLKNTFFATVIGCAFLIFNFASCNDPIFFHINNEVELADPSVFGTIASIVRNTETETVENKENGTTETVEKEYLYIANGKILRKDVTNPTLYEDQKSSSLWKDVSTPTSDYINFVAADSTSTLYALSVSFEKDEDEGEFVVGSRTLWARVDGNWKKVEAVSLAKGRSDVVSIFSTNNPIKENRRAFLNSKGTIYELSGGNATLIYDDSKKESKKKTEDEKEVSYIDYSACYTSESYPSNDNNSNGNSSNDNNLNASSRSAIVWGGKVYFHNNSSGGVYNTANLIVTDELLKSESRGTEKTEASKLYFANGSTLYYCNDIEKNPFEKDAAGAYTNVKSIGIERSAYAITKAGNSIIIGTNKGAVKCELDGDGLPTKIISESFMKNASTALSETYSILTMFSVDPSKGEDDAGCEVYASMDFSGSSSSSSAQFDRVALWSYYNERHNWNRE